MNKKNEKKLCWNCEGSVSLHLSHCPYCGMDLNQPREAGESQVPKPPYANLFSSDYTVTEEEWNHALEEESQKEPEQEEASSHLVKKEMVALLLLLPGVVFFLFGLALLVFSKEGVLSLIWNQNLAYFYFLGAIPLLYLGWRALR